MDELDAESKQEFESPVWDAIRKGETPEQLVLDPETHLEGCLTFFGCLPIMVGIGGVMVLLKDGAGSEQAYFVAGCFVVGILSLILRSNLDDHFILDFSKKEILFHRKFFSFVKKHRVCSFSEIHALVIEPKRRSSKHSTWWEYGLLAVTRSGKKIRVINPSKSDYDMVVAHSKEVADLVKATFHAGEPNTYLQVKRGPQGPEFEYAQQPSRRLFALTLSVLLLIFLAVVVVARSL